MNFLNDLKGRLPSTERLLALLAVGLAGAILLGILLFALVSVLPQAQAWQRASAELRAAESALADAQMTKAQSAGDLRQQIQVAQQELNEAAQGLMSESQAAESLSQLYQHANESGVGIVNLQNQPGPKQDDRGLYDVRAFALQVRGPLDGLVGFISRAAGAAPDAFILSNLNLAAEDGGGASYLLSMDVLIYTSPYSEGASPVTGATPTAPIIDLTPVPVPTETMIPTATPTVAPIASVTPTAAPTLVPTWTPVPQQGAVHVVQPGDTLYSISRRYGVSVEAIMEANGLSGSNIRAGQELQIPIAR